jgi:hypothetical protein
MEALDMNSTMTIAVGTVERLHVDHAFLQDLRQARENCGYPTVDNPAGGSLRSDTPGPR